jgi:hypothetical protein
MDRSVEDLLIMINTRPDGKYRPLLDVGYSFRAVGLTDRGLTELYNVPAHQRTSR